MAGENKTNLIVNYLPPELRDEEFAEMFNRYGPLKSSKICRNKATGASYGFGFAEFVLPQHAAHAIEELNGLQIGQKTIKVALSKPVQEYNSATNVFVKHIPKTYGEQDLSNLFTRYGKIVQIRILRDAVTNESKSAGYVLYENKSDAEKAVNNLNDMKLPGMPTSLSVTISAPEAKSKGVKKTDANNAQVTAKNNGPAGRGKAARLANQPYIKPGARSQPQSAELPSLFEGGQFMQAEALAPPRRRFPVQAAADPYAVQEDAYAAGYADESYYAGSYQEMEDPLMRPYPETYPEPVGRPARGVGGPMRRPRATGAAPRPLMVEEGGEVSPVFVYNIPYTSTELDMYKMFSPHGAIQKVDIMMDREKQQCKGFAFITFTYLEDAERAIMALNGTMKDGKILQVRFKSNK